MIKNLFTQSMIIKTMTMTSAETALVVTDVNRDVYAVSHGEGQAVSVSYETVDLLSFALQTERTSKDTNDALESTIYPVLTVWGFTTEEIRISSDVEIDVILQDAGHEQVDGKSVDWRTA